MTTGGASSEAELREMTAGVMSTAIGTADNLAAFSDLSGSMPFLPFGGHSTHERGIK
jgi:hypothetical protein